MKVLVALVACLAFTPPAWSLSCLRPDIVRTYEMARDAKAGFWIVLGEIVADGPIATPEPDAVGRFKENASASTSVAFAGLGMTADGSYKGFEQRITLTITCLAHWCGSVQDETHVFAAIEVKDTGPELIIDPCSSRVVPFSEDGEERLMACVRDGVCQTK